MASITSGFESVSTRLELVLLPVALDLFLWLGPHLSIKPLTSQSLRLLTELFRDLPDQAMAEQMLDVWRQLLTMAGDSVNLFSTLSIPLLGLPSLLKTQSTAMTPLGRPLVWSLDNVWAAMLVWGAFTLAGLLLGALYFGGIAQQVRDARLSPGLLFRQMWGDWARLTALALLTVIVVFVIALPAALAAGLLALFSPVLGDIVQFFASTLILWAIVFGAFTLHGLILQRRGLFGALWDSLRLVYNNLSSTAGLFAVVVVLNLGLGYVWRLPTEDSWYLLIGVGGHALLYTALITATFVYYKDRYRWWVEMQQAKRQAAKA